MGKCHWNLHVEDGVHTVELEHGYWSGKRRISVDGQPPQVGGGLFFKVWAVGSLDTISVGGHTCQVQVTPNFRTNGYDYALLLDGEWLKPVEVLHPSRSPQVRMSAGAAERRRMDRQVMVTAAVVSLVLTVMMRIPETPQGLLSLTLLRGVAIIVMFGRGAYSMWQERGAGRWLALVFVLAVLFVGRPLVRDARDIAGTPVQFRGTVVDIYNPKKGDRITVTLGDGAGHTRTIIVTTHAINRVPLSKGDRVEAVALPYSHLATYTKLPS